MNWDQFALALPFIITMTVTPGPANLSLLSVGATVGISRSLPYLFGIWMGGACVILLAAFGLGALLLTMPKLVWILKTLGFIYICWLAFKLARTGFDTDGNPTAPSFISGLILHPINPKAYVMNVMTFTAFILPHAAYAPQATSLALACFLTMVAATSLWGVCGEILHRFLHKRWALRATSLIASTLMVASVGLALVM